MKKYFILIFSILLCSLSAFFGCFGGETESGNDSSNLEVSSNSSNLDSNDSTDDRGEGLSEFMQYYVTQIAGKVSQYNGLITSDWNLPTELIYPGNIANKASITWSSSDANVFSDIGEFHKPTYDKEITLTATVYSYIGEASNPESFEIITFKLLAKGAYSTPSKSEIVTYLQKITGGEISGTSTITGGEIDYDLNLVRKISNRQVDTANKNVYEVRVEWNVNINGVYEPISQIKRGTSAKTINLVALVTFNGTPLEGDGKVYFDNVTLTAITEDEIRNHVIGQIASKVSNSFSTGDELWDEETQYGCDIKWISNNVNTLTIEQNVVTVSEQAVNGVSCPITVQVSYPTDSGSNTFNLEYVITVINEDNSVLSPGTNIEDSLYHALKMELSDMEFDYKQLTTEALKNTKFVNLDLSKYNDWFEGYDGELHAPITNLKGLAYCENLRLLNISGLNITEGLSEISSLSYLEALVAKNCNIETLSAGGTSILDNMNNLKLIDLSNNKLTTLDGILSGDKIYSKLQEIYLNDNSLTDVSKLSRAPLVKTVTLSNNKLESDDIAVLSNFTRLSYLSIANNAIDDISSLKNLTSLTELRLQNNIISDVAPLEKLTNLTVLYLGDNNISTISKLENLTNLEVLYLNNNAISRIDVMKNMIKLRVVNISNNAINNANALVGIVPTEYYSGLEELYAENNSISSFEFVKNLTSLKKLLLANNKGIEEADYISDYLKGLTNLKVLTLSGKKLNKLDFLKNEDGTYKALERLEISGCELPAYYDVKIEEGIVTEYQENIALLSNLGLTLKYLDISNNPLYESGNEYVFAENKSPVLITALRRLTQLEVFYANNVEIGDKVQSLMSGMTDLQYVSLENCKIADISWLKNSTCYVYVDLANNPINAFNYSFVADSVESLQYLYLDTTSEGASFSNNSMDLFKENKLLALSLESFKVITVDNLPDMQFVEYMNLSNTGMLDLLGSKDGEMYYHSIQRFANLKTLYLGGNDGIFTNSNLSILYDSFNSSATVYLYNDHSKVGFDAIREIEYVNTFAKNNKDWLPTPGNVVEYRNSNANCLSTSLVFNGFNLEYSVVNDYIKVENNVLSVTNIGMPFDENKEYEIDLTASTMLYGIECSMHIPVVFHNDQLFVITYVLYPEDDKHSNIIANNHQDNPRTYKVGDEIVIHDATREYFDFLGWYYEDGVQFFNDSNDLQDDPRNITLYAKWYQRDAVITFSANGGNLSETTRNAKLGDLYGSLPVPSRTNYAFVGWFTKSSGGETVGSKTQITNNVITLYAQWTLTKDTVVCSKYSTPSGTLKRPTTITEDDGVYETVHFKNLNIAKLRQLGYTKVKLSITLDVTEVYDGYKLIWIYKNAGTTELERYEFEIGKPNERIEYEVRHWAAFTFNLNDLFDSNGKIRLQYGARGENEDTWLLGQTTYTVEIYK